MDPPVAGPLLVVRGLTRRFDGIVALDDVDLEVPPGEVLGVVGPNGAGKSTLLHVVAGLLAPSAGRVLLDSVDITGWAAHRVRRAGVATVLQSPRVFPSLAAREHVAVGALFGSRQRPVQTQALRDADEALAAVGLAGRAGAPAGALDLHERRLLALATALVGRPQVLLVDEVMAGLDAAELEMAVAGLRNARDRLGLTVVWVEHVLAAVRTLADRVVVLHLGGVLADGPASTVLADERVAAAYLGSAAR